MARREHGGGEKRKRLRGRIILVVARAESDRPRAVFIIVRCLLISIVNRVAGLRVRPFALVVELCVASRRPPGHYRKMRYPRATLSTQSVPPRPLSIIISRLFHKSSEYTIFFLTAKNSRVDFSPKTLFSKYVCANKNQKKFWFYVFLCPNSGHSPETSPFTRCGK